MRWLLFIVLIVCARAEALTYTKSFTEQELQARLVKMMPIEKQKLMGSVTLNNPVLNLATGHDKLQLTLDLAVTAIGDIKGTGKVTVKSGIQYAQKDGAFYLQAPSLVSFEVNGVPSKLHSKVKGTVEKLLAKALQKRPVYRLDDQDLKQKLVKSTLKDVRIEEQELLLDFALF